MPSEAARLHPLSLLVGVPLLQIVRLLIVPAFAVVAGGGDRTPLLLLAVVGVVLAVRVLTWQRFTWSFDGEVIRVDQGVLSRSRRVVGVERVQQVELDRPLAQRLLGVATLRIETAGSDAGPEVELRVLALADALALREALQPREALQLRDLDDVHDAASGPDGATDGEDVVLRLPLRRVALASVTGAQLLLAPALLTGALQLAGDRVDEVIDAAIVRLVDLWSSGAPPDARTWLVGASVVLVVALTTTLVVAVVRDGGFVVLRVGDDLVLRRGLLGTRESTVPLHRVQVVRVSANPLRRALGVASVRIHSAGGSAGGGDRRAVIPLVGVDEVAGLLAALLPGLEVLPPLRPHPPAARRRALWRRLRGLAAWAVPLAAGWVVLAALQRAGPDGGTPGVDVPVPAWLVGALARDGAAWAVPLGVGVVLVGLQVVLATLEHAALAHGVDTQVIAARSGALTRTLSVAPLARLQGVTGYASWFQARRHLATVRAHVAGPGGDVVVLDADADAAERLRLELADASGLKPPGGS